METNRKKLFMVTQPTVAGILMAKGFEAQKIPSPFNPSKFAWLFTASTGFLRAAEACYMECGKSVPGVLYRFLKDFERDDTESAEVQEGD